MTAEYVRCGGDNGVGGLSQPSMRAVCVCRGESGRLREKHDCVIRAVFALLALVQRCSLTYSCLEERFVLLL